MAKLNLATPLSGHLSRFSLRIETNDRTRQVKA
jgi:hypothetical protein